MATTKEIYKQAKLDIIGSKNMIQLKVAKNYMDLCKFIVNFEQWNDLLRNYELKKRQLCPEV